jgi:hypothetical protein
VIAVGARHTVGSKHSAYVPAPPDDLTATLFSRPDAREPGMGFSKLDFYSPQNFELFQYRLNMDDTSGYTFCGRMPNPPDEAGPP